MELKAKILSHILSIYGNTITPDEAVSMADKYYKWVIQGD